MLLFLHIRNMFLFYIIHFYMIISIVKEQGKVEFVAFTIKKKYIYVFVGIQGRAEDFVLGGAERGAKPPWSATSARGAPSQDPRAGVQGKGPGPHP